MGRVAVLKDSAASGEAAVGTATQPLASIDIDIGNEVFDVVGLRG